MFSTEFQSLATDKGAMILHMLRWVLGEDKYNKTMRDFATEFAGKSAWTTSRRSPRRTTLRRAVDLVFLAMARLHRRPRIQGEIHNIPSGRELCQGIAGQAGPIPGFRVTGEIAQDLDLFRMPRWCIDTDGKTENKADQLCGHDLAVFDRNFRPPAPHYG